ncbi:carbohydrate sulfotransferase 9-like [Bombus huntii]|uniref:carbohydrate sulfotransferase 9-like n=1 Tax=Bombus huntii TaxID=85661 RepID=UPI0021A9C3DF|nr:carbohydrate sulfotransferase 9-like [Bombus huntii]XP_050470547.1 carbohydrate sulfotransferase 9-like [Bombus huntii]XP_050470548.1 carbohydrate sulfotransferase 9-like [Bombus huntii]XP_050470549.1 carbohydrate sulfotransferase 9-like [Bombus huntii]XP_050470550.1 carbohydrate sulfotransferase 9-like [Bombus huntii]
MYVFTNMFSGLQRQLILLKLVMIFVIIFMSFILLLSLLCNSYLHASKHVKIANYISNENYKHRNLISNKSTIALFSIEEMRNIRMELKCRKNELEQYCKIIGRTSSNLDNVLSNMIIDTTHGLSWCPIYKAASSTWMKHFATLGGVLTESAMELIRKNILQINTIVRKAFPRDRDVKKVYQKLNTTTKFLIVRHPFERLVSAYRDKLEHIEGRDYYYKRFGRHIAHKYHRYRKPNETKLEPTFTEFLRFIVEEKYFDEHWTPFIDTCEPCLIQYNYILKFDTFDRDQKFLIQELGLNEYLYEKNDLKNINPRGVTTTTLVKQYMQNVPRSLLDEINKVYEHDFKLFSYLPI